jgi:TolA-binding protein
MKTWHGRAVILSLATVLCVACAPTPLVPSGKSRIPVNSDEGISQYRERVKIDQRDRVERNGLARQVDALTKQIQELKAYVALLQLQQQEAEKGPVRQVQSIGAGSPPLHSRASDKARAKDKQAPGAKAVPPIAAAPGKIAVPPMIPITEIPTDLCGQKIGDASAYGWVDPASNFLSPREGLGAEHGLCRHIASSQEDSR